jgi:non-specific serine/threonine protein kinase
VLNEAGAATEAAALFGEALERHERLDDGRGLAQCLAGLAEVALARGSGATAGRLRGAADTQRRTAGAHPSDWERAHLDRLDLAIVGAVGRPGFEQESRAGRGMPWPAVARLARQVVASAAPSAACAGIALTERQLEVAALIAAGRTNRQIGRVLGISEKTAEVHVRNIMAKLSLTSRSGIAAWAAARAAQPPGP